MIKRGIRVNAVATDPFWTALQVGGGQTTENVQKFGQQVPDGAAGQPAENCACLCATRVRAVELYDGPGLWRLGRRGTTVNSVSVAQTAPGSRMRLCTHAHAAVFSDIAPCARS
jgi:hypothetical protein